MRELLELIWHDKLVRNPLGFLAWRDDYGWRAFDSTIPDLKLFYNKPGKLSYKTYTVWDKDQRRCLVKKRNTR